MVGIILQNTAVPLNNGKMQWRLKVAEFWVPSSRGRGLVAHPELLLTTALLEPLGELDQNTQHIPGSRR